MEETGIQRLRREYKARILSLELEAHDLFYSRNFLLMLARYMDAYNMLGHMLEVETNKERIQVLHDHQSALEGKMMRATYRYWGGETYEA